LTVIDVSKWTHGEYAGFVNTSVAPDDYQPWLPIDMREARFGVNVEEELDNDVSSLFLFKELAKLGKSSLCTRGKDEIYYPHQDQNVYSFLR